MSNAHLRVLLRAALAAILVALVTHTRADQDLFGNIRFGADVVAARSAVLGDPYSYTSAGTFMNHEWLFQVLAYSAFHAFGTAGLMAIKLGLIASMALAVYMILRAAGAESAQCDLLLGLALAVTFPQTNQVRAQLFSLAFFAWTLFILTASRRSPRALIGLVPIMALWPNLHGGWIVAAGTMAMWSGVGIAVNGRARASWIVAGAAAAALAATLLNPWGWRMWIFLYEKVDLSRPDITDWQPVFRIGAAYGALWLAVAAVGALGMVHQARSRRLDFQSAAIVLMLAFASFRVNRLLSFFGLSALMLFGADFAAWRSRFGPARAATPSRLAAGAAAAAAMAVVAFAATLSARNASCIRMEDATFTEPELTALVRERHLSGRMLTWFDYGHYAIWYFTPGIRVSMDPRREAMYSDEMIRLHLRFYFSPDDRRAAIAALRPDYIWLPSDLPVVPRLVTDGWQPLFAGPRSTLLGRGGTREAPLGASGVGGGLRTAQNGMDRANLTPRCFPGP